MQVRPVTKLRSAYGISRPSVVCLSGCRLWRFCNLRRDFFSAIFLHHL